MCSDSPDLWIQLYAFRKGAHAPHHAVLPHPCQMAIMGTEKQMQLMHCGMLGGNSCQTGNAREERGEGEDEEEVWVPKGRCWRVKRGGIQEEERNTAASCFFMTLLQNSIRSRQSSKFREDL